MVQRSGTLPSKSCLHAGHRGSQTYLGRDVEAAHWIQTVGELFRVTTYREESFFVASRFVVGANAVNDGANSCHRLHEYHILIIQVRAAQSNGMPLRQAPPVVWV